MCLYNQCFGCPPLAKGKVLKVTLKFFDINQVLPLFNLVEYCD